MSMAVVFLGNVPTKLLFIDDHLINIKHAENVWYQCLAEVSDTGKLEPQFVIQENEHVLECNQGLNTSKMLLLTLLAPMSPQFRFPARQVWARKCLMSSPSLLLRSISSELSYQGLKISIKWGFKQQFF